LNVIFLSLVIHH